VPAKTHQACAGQRAQARQAVRQEGVDRQCREGVVRGGKLLHEAHRVDHHLRPGLGHQPGQRVGVLDVDAGAHARAQVFAQARQRRGAACRAGDLEARAVGEQAQHRIAEHAGGAEDEQAGGGRGAHGQGRYCRR
jgi:hypothetical protein